MKCLALNPENLEKLFLFEIYVEKLNIDYHKLCLTQSCLESLKEITIQFQFLGFNPVEIREEEFTKFPEQQEYGEIKVWTGKSCLFSLRDLPREVNCLEVGVNVSRRMEMGGSFTLGVSSIRLRENFANILKALMPKMASASVKKSFPLLDKYCREIGKITLSINLSCFGKMITTSFQMDGDDSKAYVVQPGGEVPIADFLNKPEDVFERGICPEEQAFGKLFGGGGYHHEGGVVQTFRSAVAGGLMGGRPQTSERTKESSSSSEYLPPPPPMPRLQFCNCDYPIPPQFLQPTCPPPKKKKKKKKKKDASCPLGMMKDFCLNPGCPMGYPGLPEKEEKHRVCQAMPMPSGTIGMKGEQMIIQLPGENQPMPGNKKATFNFGGGIDNNLNNVKITTDNQQEKHTFPDKRTDIYVMKVGKTNQETDLRHRMVLELKQPKLYNEEKIVTDIRTQYLMTDFTPEEVKKEHKEDNKKDKKGKKAKKERKGKNSTNN